MAELFEELGLRPALVAAARERGYTVPTGLQRAAIPVLRRKGNALLHASAGAGTMAAYGLALLDQLAADASDGDEGDAGVKALVLVPTDEDAVRTASSLAWFGRRVGVRVAALAAGWVDPAETGAEVVVGSPAVLAAAVRGSRLKLEGVGTVVVDGASSIFSLGGGDDLETLVTLVPRDAQRIVVTADPGGAVEDFVDRHLRRALRIPPIPVELPEEPAEERPARRVDYQVVVEGEKLQTTAQLIAQAEPGRLPVVYCRSAARVEAVASELSLRGYTVVTADTAADIPAGGAIGGVVVSAGVVEAPADALVVSHDVPFDAELLLARHERGGTVLVTPRELEHLKTIARREGFQLRSGGIAVPTQESLAEFRSRLRTAVAEEDLGAQLLVLEPLFREFSPAEVAAAASALLRRRAPAPGVVPAAPPAAAPAAPLPAPSYVRLFVGVGARDGIVPSDLVGAITGEAQVKGTQIGRIEIRDTFSIVEVVSEIATRVIEAVNGITLKGRSVRVDFDRRGGAERPRRRFPRERSR